MRKVWKDWFTEPDNQTWCVIKAASAIGVLSYLGFSAIHVIQNKTFDPLAFAQGFACLIAGFGAGLLMKKDSPIQ